MCPIWKLGLFQTGILPGLPHTHTHTHTHGTFRTLYNYTICSSHSELPAHAICGGAISKHWNYLNGFETKRLTITSNQITQFKSKTKKNELSLLVLGV